jgi:hypothetical protein
VEYLMRREDYEKILHVLENVAVVMLAKAIKIYPVRMRADIKLNLTRVIGRGTQGEQCVKGGVILECPIWHNKNAVQADRKLPREGDPVLVAFHGRALDYIMKDLNQRDPKFKRILHENDAVVLGEWLYDEETPKMPAAVGSMTAYDWLLALHRENWSRIYQRDNGDIVLHPAPDNRVELVEDATHPVGFADTMAAKYNAHTHLGSSGPDTDGPPLEAYHWFEHDDWSVNVFVDNSDDPDTPSFDFQDSKKVYGNTTDDGTY